MTTTTLQDKLYLAQDITFEALDGVAQTWVQDLAAFSDGYEVGEPTWSNPGGYGSRTGWLKLTVPYTMTVTIGNADLSLGSYYGLWSWDGINAPVRIYNAYGALAPTTRTLTSGIYLIGFSLDLVHQVTYASSGNWQDAASATVTKPASIVSGDFLMTFVHLVGKNPASTITPPSDWTLVYNYDYPPKPSDSTVIRSAAYTKVATGSEPASYVWGISPSTGYSVVTARFKGVAGINSIGFNPNGMWAPPTGADGTVETGTVNVTGSASLLVADFQHSTWGPQSFSEPAGMIEWVDQQNYYIQQSLATKYVSTTGTHGPFSATQSGGSGEFTSAQPNGAFLVDLDLLPTTITASVTITKARRGLLTMGVSRSGVGLYYGEPFILGSFLLDSEEPFYIEANALTIASEELFNLAGPATLSSEEPFDQGETLTVKVEELFTIIGTEDVYIGTGSPASPKLGWRSRS